MHHNKKRDTAILFEMLIRHSVNCLMENKKDEMQKTLAVVKKFFFKGSPLSEELKAFRTLLNSHVKSPETASKILSEVCKFTKTLSAKNLDNAKSRLIKEINHCLDAKTIYSYRIPEYRTYATVQLLFNNARNKGTPLEAVERLRLEESIIEKLTTSKVEENTEILKVNPKHNSLINRFATKRFVEKYKNSLSEEQKHLLTRYATSLLSESGAAGFKTFISEQVENIKKTLSRVKDESLNKDQDLMARIEEAKGRLVSESFDKIDDEKVVKLLQFMQLAKEIEK